MLRLTPRRNRRTRHALAILAVLLLAASVLAGAGNSVPTARQQAGIRHEVQNPGPATVLDAGESERFETDSAVGQAAYTKARKLRVSLFLFRH
jgi:hypothetical protein